MRPINSLFLTPAVSERLINARYLRILHVFEHACNLLDERGEVLSVVTPQIGKGPFNLLVEKEICFSEHLSPQSPVSISQSHLYLGGITINLKDASSWSPRPNWESLHAKRNHILPQLNQFPITSDLQASLQNQSLISSLSSALVNADVPTARNISAQLAGLGPGLTPSGDDILMGAMYATWMVHPPGRASLLTKKIADHAAPLTTSLSAAWLRSAGRGEAGIAWHELFHALVAGENIQLPVTKLLSIGETSGTDAWAGFMSVINGWAKGQSTCFQRPSS